MAKRAASRRIRDGFIKTYKPVLDDEASRHFESMVEYRRWCNEKFPKWLGYAIDGF